jgi:SAM-dependent methyltransferase
MLTTTPARAGLTPRRQLLAAATALSLLGLALPPIPAGAAAGPQAATQKRPDAPSLAPYVPTPQEVVDRMLQLAQVGKGDVVYDLGCGDGRIPITAAKIYGARGVGVDIDPQRIAEANANAKREGVAHLVSFKLQNAMTTDVSEATVVTLYLLSASNLKLRPILTRQLKPGARIVSHAFSMGDWQPDKVDTFTDTAGGSRTLYLWKTDGKVRQ